MKAERIIIAGGAGFIGSTLAERLATAGKRITVVDNLWRGRLSNLSDSSGRDYINLDEDFVLADLTDSDVCRAILKDADLVYHLADIVAGIGFVFGNESYVFRQNVVMNSNVIAACVENEVPALVYVGTACSYPRELQTHYSVSTLTEDQVYPAHPESAYGWSKIMGEYEATLAHDNFGLNVGLLRLHNVYGPRSTFDPAVSQVVPALIRKALLYPSEPFEVWGSGRQYRDFVFVDDVVEALIALPDYGMNKGAIQVATGEPVSVRELAEAVVGISGKPIRPTYDTTRPEGDLGRVGDWARAKAILGWSPKTDLHTGLRRTYDWVADQLSSEEAR